jgi:hypothetical protein
MTWHSKTRCYFGEMADDDDNETGMSPEERRRWRIRRGMYVRPIAAKKLRAEARKKVTRKKRLRRKRNGSVQRRKVGPDDGRRAWVKRMKANGRWPPPSINPKDDVAEAISSQPSPPSAAPQLPSREDSRPSPPPPTVYPGELKLKPRVEQGTVRQSFSKGRIKTIVIEKRGEKL